MIHAISSEWAEKLKLFLKNVVHHGWATKKSLGSRKLLKQLIGVQK